MPLPRLLLLLALASPAAFAAPGNATPDDGSPSDGWPAARAADTAFEPARLKTLDVRLGDGSLKQLTSVMVVQRGQPVYERYFNGADAGTLHDVRSATKSVTALLVGAAIDRGLLPGVQDRVYDRFPQFTARHEVDPRLRATTLADLLTMSSQWECNDENPFSSGNEERMYVTERWLDFALALPVKGYAPWMSKPADSPHGRAFAYCTAGSFVAGAVVERAAGKPLAEFAAETLERPLGIARSQWNRSPEGIGMGGGGTRYRTRDLAKFGQLVVDHGRWQGRQVISADYIAAMTSEQAKADDDAEYGYQWWRLHFDVGGRDVAAWAMSGNGGNYVMVVPERQLVAVITSTAYNQRNGHTQSREIFRELLAALR
ncbi:MULTISPECIES: serine hydrolase [unclassified Lysobacter]|uniref:serine hydrolase domain-containing protein n=1 Tax=unclassified Lysobacter TaxID=2635362 RepID=UPI0007005426|nr:MULTISPECIES: serine hydrolase [unclassified Lysobacter]KRC35053.1 serine hydrolase [Lysobacter sp. Root76]KRD70742.1 serine hydrolase [Lysobacter sp. Root96]